MRRVGILGGSFDPVHAAHLALARAAADTFALDEVRLMPCAQQALKRRRPAPAEDRCALLRLALGGDPRLTLDCRELWRRGKVYTIDTILELRAELPGAELWFILGMDAGALGRRARWLGAPGGRSGPKPRTGSRHPHGSAGDGGRLHQPRPRLAHTGGYRYAFNCDGEQSLFIRCHSEEGRHDFVTGARTPGPNVFTACTAVRSKADIGPHHRWSVGTLYDRIKTDGRLYVQDRGNAGTGHGWAGVTQVLWNCEAQELIVQSPWVSGKNYCFGCLGRKHPGRWGKGRPDGIWEGHQRPGVQPPSLYQAQLSERQRKRRAEAK